MIDGHGLPGYGHAGQWTAFIEPHWSHRQKFHLVRRTHAGPGVAASFRDTDGNCRAGLIRDCAVTFQFTELDDGAPFPDPATLQSGPMLGDAEVRDFLQACVDCAADLGITARKRNPRDTEREGALRDHLEDMRRLVYRAGYEPLKQPR